ncbi:MFS general substrate transporter [Peniophora sp. CONT]|nr:MFS general substrate transporter [Peniophora sp. CONT]
MTSSSDTAARRHTHALAGWLGYAFASEVFVIVSLTLYLPICLEQFARDNGYLLPERTVPCIAAPAESNARCVVKLGWAWLDTASFSLYVSSLSVALQALTVISIGALADTSRRKPLLLSFAALGSLSALCFFFLSSTSVLWWLVAPLAILANVGFGASFVALNAYLPQLARSAPDVRLAREALAQAHREAEAEVTGSNSNEHLEPLAVRDSSTSLDDDDASAPLLQPEDSTRSPSETLAVAKQDYTTALSRATARISAQGIALGYSAGIILLLLTIIPVSKLGGSTWALRLSIGCSGAWWALFSVGAGWALPSGEEEHDGDEEEATGGDVRARVEGAEGLGLGEDEGETGKEWSVWGEIVLAWRRLFRMLRPSEIRRLGNTFIFLAAWFLLSDGFTTITSTAVLFAKTTLKLPSSTLVLVGVLTPSAGIAGALAWPRLQRRLRLSNLKTLLTLVSLAAVVPAYGCLGLSPTVRAHGLGLVTTWEMLVLAVYFGSVYGAFQSYARALYAEVIPRSQAARWYALFSITDKSSSFLGPLAVGLIADGTGNIRYAFLLLTAVLLTALPILSRVDVAKGAEDAEKYAAREGGAGRRRT